MARIRTIKPEAFVSESLAEVTVEAERTFFGLLTQADDHGRHRDNAAIIAGLLWPLRSEHTSVHVEDDLTQLADAGLICRYTGCDGRRYLHVMTWYDHQKIDRPSQSRMPVCPHHDAERRCGACKGACTVHADAPQGGRTMRGEGSTNPPRSLATEEAKAEGSSDCQSPEPGANAQRRLVSRAVAQAPGVEDTGQGAVEGPSADPRRTFDEDSAPGSRILDPGASIPSGRAAPEALPHAQRLVAEYVKACGHRPPGDVIAHVGRVVKKLLGEGIESEHVRAGLRRYAEIQGHPSRLPSLVNDAMNAVGGPARSGHGFSFAGAHSAWTNPVNPAAYTEDL